MILSSVQERRFFKLLLALADYANEEFEILGHPFVQTPQNAHYDEEKREILYEVWENDEIIQRFVSENPHKLDKRDLKVIESWKYALTASFVVANHENGHTHFMKDDKAYAVMGLSREISSMLSQTPAFARTTLLPFEGRIVYDSTIQPYPIEMMPHMAEMIEEEFREAKRGGKVVTQAEELIGNAEHHRDMAHQRELDEQIVRHISEKRKADPDSAMPEGMHKGILSGLSFEERQKIIEQSLEEFENDPEDGEETWFKKSLVKLPKGDPPRTLVDALARTTRDDLVELAKSLGIPGAYKLKKAELVELFMEDEAMLEEFIEAYYLTADERKFELFCNLMKNEGLNACSVLEITRHDLLPHRPPFIMHTKNGSRITTTTPLEMVEHYHDMDIESLQRRRTRRKHIEDCANVCIGLYGVIVFAELYDLIVRYYPEDEISLQEFAAELLDLLFLEILPYGIWHDRAAWYELEEAATGDGTLFTTMYLCDVDFVTEEPDEWFYEEDEEADDHLEDYDFDEDENLVIAERRSYLLQRQGEIPRKILAQEEVKDFFILDHIRRIPEVRELLQYLDDRIPDEESDVFFADGFVANVCFGFNSDAPVTYYLEMLERQGYSFIDDDQINDFLLVFSQAINAMPRWANNGHSATQLMELMQRH